jgi:hypothetical protein
LTHLVTVANLNIHEAINAEMVAEFSAGLIATMSLQYLAPASTTPPKTSLLEETTRLQTIFQ